MSRIERKRDNLEGAEKLATNSIAQGGCDHRHIHVGLLIARAEARLRRRRLDEAIDDLTVALGLVGGNLRTRGVCLLRLAELHAVVGDSRSAHQHFEQWQQIRSLVSNVHLDHLEGLAKTAIEGMSQDFTVRMNDKHVAPRHLTARLNEFMAAWARNRAKSDLKAAELLGISRQTLVDWGGPAKNPRLRRIRKE